MSSCMDRLGQIVVLAKSKKVTEYKKAIKQLLEFWDDNSEVALRQISENSKNPAAGDRYSAYTWNELFNIVHELFVTEIERISRLSGNSGTLDKDRIIKLVYATTERASYHLKPKDVVLATLRVLQSDVSHIYSEHYDMYLGILRKYVLQERSQRILVVHSHWSELLTTCVSLIINVMPNVNYVKVLETIQLIVQYGSSLSNLLYDTKKLLPVIGKLLGKYETYDIKSTDILFKLAYTVCHEIVVDSRLILCRFVENMPLSLINLKGPDEKYKLYLLFIQVHHPNGVVLGDDDYYAFDNDKWKAILSLLFKMILNDIKPVTLSESFVNLSCEVFRQQICTDLPSLSQTSSFHDSLYIQPKKKRRIDEKEKVINLVNDRDPTRAWPMIQIATVLYRKYPDCLKFDEYTEFLDVTTKLMNQACKNYLIMESLCELATVLIQNEIRYGEEDLKAYWDKVWDAALRYLSMTQTDVVKKGCMLVQNLISHKKVSDPNSLLKLYLTKSIQWSKYSVQTLRVICENFVLPSDIANCDINLTQSASNSLKFQLLQATVNAFTKRISASVPLDEFSKILIGFTLKSWYKTEDLVPLNASYTSINLDHNFYVDLRSITTEDIERCYLSLKIKTDFSFVQSENHNLPKSKNEIVDYPYVLEDLEFLVNSLLEMMQTDDADKDLSLFITKTALIAQIISDLKVMGMIRRNFDDFILTIELRACLAKAFDQIKCFNWTKSTRNNVDVTRALISLFQGKYDVLVNDVILSSVDLAFLKKMNDVSKLRTNEFEGDDKLSNCKINAVIVLALYCSVNTGGEISDMQLKIMSTILKVKKYSLANKTDVICITTLLDIFANYPDSMVSEEFIELLMPFIMELFEGWQRDDRFNCCFLKLLPKILDKIVCIDDRNQIHNVLLICKLFHDRFVKGAFGQVSNLTLVQCLNQIVQHKVFSNTEIEVLKDDVFVDFVKSPYYFVRLESLKYLYSIFSMKHIGSKWKSDFFDKLKGAVYNLFIMQNRLSEVEIQEEKLLRSVSAVQILAAIACSKSTFQSPALLVLLQTAVDKGIDENIVKKIIQVINRTNGSKSMIEEKLNYLLTSWCRESSLDTFPFDLLDCHDETDFYTRYLEFVFPALIREGKEDKVRHICNQLEIPFEQTFKQWCSSIIPWALIEKEELIKQLKDNSGIFKGVGSLTLLIKDNLQQIVIQTVQRLHDLNNFYEVLGTTIDLPASDPPHFNIDAVDRCFEQLIKVVGGGETRQTIFYFIMTRRPNVLQKILLQLTRNIYTGSLSEHKAKAFHQYIYLCSKIIQELGEKHCDATAPFFVRDIGCTLLNLTQMDDEFIARVACKYLHVMLANVLPCRSEQVSNILALCVKTLAPLVRDPNENSPAKDVLMLLLVDNKQRLAEAIKHLSSLPSFVKSRSDLDTESELLRVNVQHFLSTSDDKNCSIDSLMNLKRQLIEKSDQLKLMYEGLETLQGFAEHCATSPLHRLIYRLVRLSVESSDTRISLEAAKCLGVLGPADLSTMILHPRESQGRESLDKADTLTRKVCELLAEFIVSSDIDVRAASSEALYVVLESPWGSRLLSDMEFESSDQYYQSFGDYLYPFRSTHKSTTSSNLASFKIDVEQFERTFDPENPIWSESSSSGCYDSWLTSITPAVANCLSGFYSASLVPLFRLSVQFCEATLPRFVSLLIDAYPNLSTKVCNCINRLFHHHFNVDVVERTALGVPQTRLNESRDTIRCMLEVVNHLRIQSNEQVHLQFDYLPIAMAAQYSSAYFSSVLYAELWCRTNLKVARDFDSIPIIDQVYEQDNKLGKIAQDILKEAYIKIGDPDSIYGCGSSHLQNRRSRIPYYTNFQKFDKVLLSHDVELSMGNNSVRGMINSLRESNLYYLAKHVSSAVPMEVDMDDLCYDTLWRLGDWSQITSLRKPQSSKKVHDYSVYHYEALKSLHENDKGTMEKCLREAHFCIIKELSNISLESCKAVYPKLCQLQMLREIEEFGKTNPDDIKTLLSSWEKQKYICNNNFQYVEPILAQRAVMFEIKESLPSNAIVKTALVNTQLDMSRLAQHQGHLNVAARALESLSKQTDLQEEAENRLLYCEARLAWIRKDEDLARFNLRTLIGKSSTKPSLRAHALRVYGNWIAENKSENPQTIINKYYNKALGIYMSMPKLSRDELMDGCKARAALAQFAHEQYLMITEYLKSPQFESLKECIDYSRNVVPKNTIIIDQDVERACKISKRQSSNDYIEMGNIQKDRTKYLTLAISNYLGTLEDSEEHDLLIFRLVSLWLDNMYDDDLNKIFDRHLFEVPSYKFIPLVPQLAPHMSNVTDTFSSKISALLERCAKEHPHHTLPVLLALKNLHNDSKFCEKKVTSQEPRVLGAKQLIQKLMSTNIRPIIQEMDKCSDALVQLAYLDLEKKNKAMIANCPIPRKLSLHEVKNFQYSLVMTVPIDVKKDGNYSNIVSVCKYEENYSNVGGINAPKKIMCLGTDGIQRPQLVKGKDDLRQDAVMQQVFTVMNSLLKTNKEAKHRKLHVRTYKVVPLTQRSGVLQWCENTLPLSSILTGDGSRQFGLHRKYYPNDYAPHDCRLRLKDKKDPTVRFNIFVDCCKNLRPAFHHFFTENYLSPETWFERRLAYTRSVATTSIIGYILGLGDRHVSNILLDKTTAEVIHIDFGIAFEQGKVLPTPETVPFRLTRDIESAMGVSGVEGTMRRCCEETMSVLRKQREIIVTLLRVLLYDPLYSWAITPAKAATYQSEQSSRMSDTSSPVNVATNKLAERALLRVQQKLQGIEEGVTSSVSGQVERLIQQARDPVNLSKLFEGWQAYL